MNKIIKIVLIITGCIFLFYGGYELIKPEATLDIGIVEFKTQNNNNAYITIGIGVLTLISAFLVKNK